MILGRLAQLARNAWLGRNPRANTGNISMTLTPERRATVSTHKATRSGMTLGQASKSMTLATQSRTTITGTPTRRLNLELIREP